MASRQSANHLPYFFIIGHREDTGLLRAACVAGIAVGVIVRKNRAEYPATKDRPAYVHDDLMIIYRDSEKGSFRAIFFDNEGHVIHYAIQASPDENSFQFLSDASPNSPRFRLTYSKSGPKVLDIKFELAPPGKPDSFSQFIGGKIRRKE